MAERIDMDLAAPTARTSIPAVADALKISPTERLVLAEMIRIRKLPVSRDGHLAMDQLLSMLREIRGTGA